MAANAPIELEPVGGAHALLAEVESALVGDVDVAHLHRSLASSRDVFLNLLNFKVRENSIFPTCFSSKYPQEEIYFP